uniref:GYF domain-containing protein n=1 Tax=Parascaris univalens TaxID=6257 RepID=A0A915ARV5_PARUN
AFALVVDWVVAARKHISRFLKSTIGYMDAASTKFTDGATQEALCGVYSADIMEAACASLNSPKWYYKGQDLQIHGPYPSTEMLKWCKAGYFTDSMPLRTESEDRFHTLAEWVRYANGQNPFLMLVNTFDELVNISMNMHLSQLILTPARVPPPAGPFVVMPPPTPASAPPVSLGGFSHVQAAPSFIAAYPPNPLVLPPPTVAAVHQPLSQPPSEPVDELPSSASNTPDDTECAWIANGYVRNELINIGIAV